jgi:hypothetical protein
MHHLAALLVVTTSLGALAQPLLEQPFEPGPRQSGPNLLTVNPGDLFGGIVSVEYERALTSRFGLTAGLQAWTFRAISAPDHTPTFQGLNPEVGAKLHFFRDAPGGAWLGLTVNLGAVLARSDGPVTRPWSWGAGAAVGYTFILEEHLTFQFGLGGGFVDYGERVVWSPRLLMAVGSAF